MSSPGSLQHVISLLLVNEHQFFINVLWRLPHSTNNIDLEILHWFTAWNQSTIPPFCFLFRHADWRTFSSPFCMEWDQLRTSFLAYWLKSLKVTRDKLFSKKKIFLQENVKIQVVIAFEMALFTELSSFSQLYYFAYSRPMVWGWQRRGSPAKIESECNSGSLHIPFCSSNFSRAMQSGQLS